MIHMTLILAALIGAAGCTSGDDRQARPVPPPIARGKCVVDMYVGDVASKQICQYQGSSWYCSSDICVRDQLESGGSL